jgi:hypothetical protein
VGVITQLGVVGPIAHEYVVAPVAVNTEDAPKQTVLPGAEGIIDIIGNGLTKKV